jgi:hypothetical protein
MMLVMWSAETVVVCALTLLSRNVESFPPVEFVTIRPAHVSADAEAFVERQDTRIFMIITTRAFSRARTAPDRCGDLQAIRKVASILIHEEWHVRHTDNEAEAYTAQLTALHSMNAGPGNPLYSEVSRAMRAALSRRRVWPN